MDFFVNNKGPIKNLLVLAAISLGAVLYSLACVRTDTTIACHLSKPDLAGLTSALSLSGLLGMAISDLTPFSNVS